MRDVVEIVADLATNACGSPRLVPVDTMRLYRAMQKLPLDELDLLVSELTLGACAIAPRTAPLGWNERMKRGYSMLLERARGVLLKSAERITPPTAAN